MEEIQMIHYFMVPFFVAGGITGSSVVYITLSPYTLQLGYMVSFLLGLFLTVLLIQRFATLIQVEGITRSEDRRFYAVTLLQVVVLGEVTISAFLIFYGIGYTHVGMLTVGMPLLIVIPATVRLFRVVPVGTYMRNGHAVSDKAPFWYAPWKHTYLKTST